MGRPLTESDLKFLIDWYGSSNPFTKHQIQFLLRRWIDPNTIDANFDSYLGELDYMPPQMIAFHNFQGGLFGTGLRGYFRDAQVTVSLISKTLRLGIWIIGGPNDKLVIDGASPLVFEDLKPPSSDTLGFTFGDKTQVPQESFYEILLTTGSKPRFVFPSGPRETPIGLNG